MTSKRVKFHQKLMSALSENVKVSSLTEEVVRRLKHTKCDLPDSHRHDSLEDLCQRMCNSGHTPMYIKSILSSIICMRPLDMSGWNSGNTVFGERIPFPLRVSSLMEEVSLHTMTPECLSLLSVRVQSFYTNFNRFLVSWTNKHNIQNYS